MERFTISLDGELAKEFDALIAERGYGNRSEAVRDIIRAQLEAWRLKQDEAAHCVANLSYIYNHHERELAERLTLEERVYRFRCVEGWAMIVPWTGLGSRASTLWMRNEHAPRRPQLHWQARRKHWSARQAHRRPPHEPHHKRQPPTENQ